MNDFPSTSDDETLALIDLRAILDWLATPPAAKAEDELAPLHAHLTALREIQTAAHQRHKVLDLLYSRAHGVVQRLLPDLTGVSLPLSRRIRHTVRGMQDLLLTVAEDYLNTLGDLDEHLIKGLRRPRELTLWRALDALGCHLLISNHVASPAGVGIWQRLHRTYALATEQNFADVAVRGAEGTLRAIYLRTLLLACAQPASFSSREIDLVVEYINRFGIRAEFLPSPTENPEAEGIFWIDPDRDAPPTASSRQAAPEGALCFTCASLSALLEEQMMALEAGLNPGDIDLPESAATPVGHGVLRRLAHYWGHAGKRRFPRRRQNYRAVLCVGLPALWQLFHDEHTKVGELTSWMVTNESPDGYALMHVSGKTARLAAGDIVAIRTETISDWQICIVRWALSENPEHLELGLQILATRATSAFLAASAVSVDGENQPVLILPKFTPMRRTEALVAPAGTAQRGRGKLVLLVEQDNLEIREMLATHLDEQTSSIEVIAIEPSKAP
ncbi:MAG: hypothetical protein IPL58_12070 [Betaproteobacteria bacterium]|jgi:hypothetical protein|uniref:Uncharacterized protein n=1 Tax=Candidatus Proximibacter danicus TaxID=2954365 RepID=A0A9D7K5J7_9PROT|nr:hypothetical protein [Candidatus Proximibacter danicus]